MQSEVSKLMDEAGSGRIGGSMGIQLTSEQSKILNYAKQQDGAAAITLAVEGGSMTAAPFILGSNDVVIGMGGMGGFSGADDAPSVAQLQQWVSSF